MSDIQKVLGSRPVRFARLARIVLWSEAIVAAFWPAVTLVGAFFALALFGIPTALPPLVHLALLVAFAAGLAWLLYTGKRGFRAPAPEAAPRRVERDSGLAHRPFTTLVDAPATDASPAGRGLWQMHLERRRADIRRLRLSFPHPDLPARDPRAIRLLVLILLVLGFAAAGPRSGGLIADAFDPSLGSTDNAIPLNAWIKPPAYTGIAPILLDPTSDAPVAVPTGSTIEAHVTGGAKTPRLVLAGDRKDFRAVEGGGYGLTETLTKSGTLSIRQGWGSLAHWKIAIIPDHPPTVAFSSKPSETRASALKIDYGAFDDYGVASVELRARIVPSARHIVAEPISAMLTAEQNEKELKGTSFQDLTAHPWAGMQVLAKLVATDGAGQTGETPELIVKLPERDFYNETARELIGARKQVIMNATPWRQIAANVASVAFQPDKYNGDLTIFLALRAAFSRLNTGKPENEQAVGEIEDLLWNSALALEVGDRPDAEDELRAAEDALDKSLKDPKSKAEEIAQQSQKLHDAVNRYLDALGKDAAQKQEQGQDAKSSDDAKRVNKEDVAKMIDKMKEMANEGARESAEAMLNNLKNMLDNMEAEMNGTSTAGGESQKGQQALDQLKSLADKQRDLMKKDAKADAQAAQNQDALRKALGDAIRKLDEATGQIPPTLSAADRAMKDAAKALQMGLEDDAKAQQKDAASNLDQAVQGLSGQLSSQGEDGQAFRDGEHGRDPFGRGNPETQGVKVPTERQMTRAIELLDELRRRAGEHDRPRPELDYLQRLLQQF